MNNFGECCFLLQLLPGIWSFVLLLTGVVPLFFAIRLRRLRLLPLLAAGILPVFAVFQFVQEFFLNHAGAPWAAALISRMAALPVSVFYLVCGAAAAVQILTAVLLSRYRQTHITPTSLKEAADGLPTAICIYVEDGTVLLKNHRTSLLCEKTGFGALFDGAAFSGHLHRGVLPEGVHRLPFGAEDTLVFPDGTAVSVTEKPLPSYGAVMLLAADVTEEYRAARELERQRDALQAASEKLMRFQQDIVQMTAKQEILHAKIRVHDRLGGQLLQIKRYLTSDESDVNGQALLAQLQQTAGFLQQEVEPEKDDEYALMLTTAARLGVTVEIDGALPEREPEKHVVACAIHECMTNTLRHASGNLLRISVTGGKTPAIHFTNNGLQPFAPIRETGGLKQLRTLAQDAGCSMEITSLPEFRLTIHLPQEETICRTESYS